MFERLKYLAARLTGRLPFFPGPADDPLAGVREPRKRGPGGRSSAVAVMEPPPDRFADAIGGVRPSSRR